MSADDKKAEQEAKKAEQEALVPLKQFLESSPPGAWVTVDNPVVVERGQYGEVYRFRKPELALYCPQPTCNRSLLFEQTSGAFLRPGE